MRFDEPQIFFRKHRHEVNFAMIRRGSAGTIVTPRLDQWPWPAGAFMGAPLTLRGVTCRALTLRALLEEKERYQQFRGVPLRPKDDVSIRLLRELIDE